MRGGTLTIRAIPRLLPLALAVSLIGCAGAARAQDSGSPRDPFARLIARSDAIVVGRVLEAGSREVPVPGSDGRVVTAEGFARIAVQRWIVGPDRDSTLELAMGSHDRPVGPAWQEAQQPGRSVILYLLRSRGLWMIAHEVPGVRGRPYQGIEFHTSEDALARVPAILREAAISAPDSLAARADLGVVARLEDFTDDPPGMVGRVEQVAFGALPDSFLTIAGAPTDALHRGQALLLLAARPDGRWKVLDDGAGCYYLYHDRVAHSLDSLAVVLERMAAVHARHAVVVGGGR